MKKIAVVTATRAEYGLLHPIINHLRKYEDNKLKIVLIVTGTHLSVDFGYTINEITSDEIRIDKQIEIPVLSNSSLDISKNQAETLVNFTDEFEKEKYDGIVILGDRYEMLAVAIAAANTYTPIFHICGGDTTEGAMDEWIRHSITKMSYLHFTTNDESRRRVIQLGESPERVYNFGSTSIDNIINMPKMTKKEVLESIGLDDGMYALCTYHPVTMEDCGVEKSTKSFLDAIKSFSHINFVVTKSNADKGGAIINSMLDNACKKMSNLYVYTSLGIKKYLSLMKYAEFVMGNSSSGIIETPVFHIPTINIGDRQRGRLQSESTINCNADTPSIVAAINKAITDEFRHKCENVVSPYGDGNAAKGIAKKIVDVVLNENIDLKKKFYDLK